jgi:adenylosuccinate lyase
MPHKVNPIDYENSEGNLGISKCYIAVPCTEVAGEPFAK